MEIVGGEVGGLFGRGREAEQVAAKHQNKYPCLLWISHLIFSDGSGALTPERTSADVCGDHHVAAQLHRSPAAATSASVEQTSSQVVGCSLPRFDIKDCVWQLEMSVCSQDTGAP